MSPSAARDLRDLALLLWGAFLVAESTFRLLGLYWTFPPVDVASHFLAGAALAATFLWIFTGREVRGVSLLSLVGVLLVAVGWEAMELVDEAISPDPPPLRDRFLWDGFFDVLVSGIAGVLVIGIARGRSRARS